MPVDADQGRPTSPHYQGLSAIAAIRGGRSRNAAISPAPSVRRLDIDDAGAGRLARGTTRQDLRANQLCTLPLDRSRDPKSAQDRAAVPNFAQEVPDRNPW